MFLVPGLLPIKKNFLGMLPLFALDKSWCAEMSFAEALALVSLPVTSENCSLYGALMWK